MKKLISKIKLKIITLDYKVSKKRLEFFRENSGRRFHYAFEIMALNNWYAKKVKLLS